MSVFFLLLRVTTGLMAVAGLAILLAIVLLRSGAAFAKESVGVIGYVAALFTSGFTKGTPPKDPAGWVVSLPLAGLAVLFVAMLVSVFLPGTKILLHIIAAFAGVALVWFAWMLMTESKLEILSLPLVVVWLVYYALCVFWFSKQVMPSGTGL